MQDDLQKVYPAYQHALYSLPNPKILLTRPLSRESFLTVKQENTKLLYRIGILHDRYGSLDNAEEAFSSVLKVRTLVHAPVQISSHSGDHCVRPATRRPRAHRDPHCVQSGRPARPHHLSRQILVPVPQTTNLGMLSSPTRGLQSSPREMVQSLNDGICSSTRRPRARSYPLLLLLLRKMFIPLCMQA